MAHNINQRFHFCQKKKKITLLQWISIWNDAAEALNPNQSIAQCVRMISTETDSHKWGRAKLQRF